MSQLNPIESSINDATIVSLANLFKKAIEEKSGVSNYSFEGNDLYASYAPIENSEWIFVITANTDEVLSSIGELQSIIIKVLLLVLAISIVLVYMIWSSIVNPVILAVNHSKVIASLDLTKDVPEKFMKRKDEIGELAQSLQTIIDALKKS